MPSESIGMSLIIVLSIFIYILNIISANFLNAESNYLKPQLERNNIVNKGVWIRKSKDRFFEKSESGDFIFRANSLDVDSLLQNNFDAFGQNDMEDAPGITSYIERTKRSNNAFPLKNKQRDTFDECNGNDECINKIMDRRINVKSTFISKLKPTSVINDYPYELAILLSANEPDEMSNYIRKAKEISASDSVTPLNKNKDVQIIIDPINKSNPQDDQKSFNENNNNTIIPKRSMKHDYETKVIKKIEITEDLNGNNQNYTTQKFDRGIFDTEDRVWHQSVPEAETTYKISPKYPSNKPINERGLIKVLSMLTKTFKKIMKQHSDIRKIHSKLHNINDEVNKNIAGMTKRFQDIEDKYAFILSVSDRLKDFESRINAKEEYYREKDKQMANNLLEFEKQQKTFLAQQRQFYKIQKILLEQNEKINLKQNLIAKTQSEIAHRQNNFARILKKAKQIYIDQKHLSNKISSTTIKPIIVNDAGEITRVFNLSTSTPPSTESIKINLFSIPTMNKLINQDTLILKDKDEHPVDDLVYKYYFNNTFIDNLMKSKILSTFVTTAENTEIARNTKTKRNNDELANTLLLPIKSYNKSEFVGHREKRWIRHHSKTKSKKKSRGKNTINIHEINDEKPIRLQQEETTILRTNNFGSNAVTKMYARDKNSPFVLMAKSFCNEIGQSANEQMLHWCVEKALRRLQNIDMKMSVPLTVALPVTMKPKIVTKSPKTLTTTVETTYSPTSSLVPSVTPSPITSSPLVTNAETVSTTMFPLFFPDNDELEKNLKEFDLKPDTEGNVYYDGSMHASDIVGLLENSEGFSDIMPGLDSNSKVEVDPMTFDLQARRRDTVRRINANILRQQRG